MLRVGIWQQLEVIDLRKTKGLVPRYFLMRFGVDEQRPAWYVMFLAAMASGAVYATAWLAVMILLPFFSTSGGSIPAVMVILLTLTLWGSSTLWYHLLYLVWYRRSKAAGPKPETETSYSVWGGLVFMFVILLLKLMWVLLKYICAPMIPFMLIVELRNIPLVGTAVCNIACVALMLYPLIMLGIRRAIGHRRRAGKTANG